MTGRGRAAGMRLTLQLLALLLIAPLASGDAIGGLLTRVQAFFDVTPPSSYKRVVIWRGEVPAKPFLDACTDFLPLIERLGKVFYPVKADIEGNIKKLQAIAKKKHRGITLHQLLREEQAAGGPMPAAGDALLWLKRALQFMNTFLGAVASGGDAGVAARAAYSSTLEKHHGFVVRRTFSVGLSAAPSTDSILERLGGTGANKAEVRADLAEWVAAAAPLIVAIDSLLIKQGLDPGA